MHQIATTPHPGVNVTSVTWSAQYLGASSGYFGVLPIDGCLPCPMLGNPGGAYTVTLYLVNNGSSAHVVQSVSVNSPFRLATGYSAGWPVSIPSGSSHLIIVTILYPGDPGTYALAGEFTSV